jgi:hypothetical protein
MSALRVFLVIERAYEEKLAGLRCDDFAHESLDACLDIVSYQANDIVTLARGVREFPVFVALSWEDRARITAAHGDDDVTGFYGINTEKFGSLSRNINPFFGHDLNRNRV